MGIGNKIKNAAGKYAGRGRGTTGRTPGTGGTGARGTRGGSPTGSGGIGGMIRGAFKKR